MKIRMIILNTVLLFCITTGILLLGGCTTTQTLPPGGQTTEAIIATCNTYQAALKALTPVKSTMSAANIAIVNAANNLTQPICGNPAAYNSNGALAALQAEIGNLQAIKTIMGIK